MKHFDELLEVATALNAPGGCPWDQKQTFFSLQPYVLEEAHELVEAVDGQKDEEIIEELGDLLYTVLFYAQIAQKEQRFSLQDILTGLKEKLIRRHPHVFGDSQAKTEEEIRQNWEKIKKEETGKEQRTSSLDGIPDQLPSLAKAQKMMQTFLRSSYLPPMKMQEESQILEQLFQLIQTATSSEVDLESSFRRYLSEKRKNFIKWEENKKS